MSIELFFPGSRSQRGLRIGPLVGELDGFAAWLATQGYARKTASDKLWLARHLSVWLEREGLGVEFPEVPAHARSAGKNQRRVDYGSGTALARAGIDAPLKGAHLLRRSPACGMLNNGASLEEIGRILRHRRPETTQIYAKLDLEALRPLAPAWPGGAS